ncbi:hypothetical protein HXX76_010462 [Chlamydomonas incerta]|uniref:Peptidase C1A papain C-terminal domain-containing protein n=1 Tax=Chlamydomonas incerta TaxID=51695 RepID=A0A835SU40_CHLIN|nr:hypothetical protein HXX76_010462 [Chlamydomonas incerta]|eukprot:KAG2428314.1 hypothetical protein HXX76_010462 [Chlamydomonas incerta]
MRRKDCAQFCVSAFSLLVLLADVGTGDEHTNGLEFPTSNRLLSWSHAWQHRYSTVEPPLTWDWRTTGAISEPKDQGQCGACYAYAVVHAIAAIFSLRGGISSARVDLAELQAALCNADKTTAGCSSGWIGETYQYAMKRGILEADAWSAMMAGVATQQCPRDAVEAELAKLLDAATRATARAKQILGWERAPPSEHSVTQIVSNQPAVAVVHAPEDWKTYDDGTGVYVGACSSDPRRANHAVLIVGYTETEWIVQNSWGTRWGTGGYMRLPRDPDSALGRNPCGLLNHVTYPVLDQVTPERRGDLVQEGYCSGVDLVASSGGAGRTVRQLAEHYNVPINDFLRINTHITADPDALLDVNTAFYVPPCTRNVPKPPVPTLDCGTTYHVSYQPATGTATSAYDQSGAAGRRLREAHAAELQQEQARMRRRHLLGLQFNTLATR